MSADGSAIHRLPPAARAGLAHALQPAFLVAACVSVVVFVIAVVWVKEQQLRRSLDEIDAVEAAAATPATVAVESSA